MKTSEQRISAVHIRTEELSRRREKDILILTAVCSCILLGVLIPLAAVSGSPSAEGSRDVFAAASLLDESAGSYILTALAAFMAGAVLTVICVKLRNRDPEDTDPEKKNKGDPDL